MTFDLLKGVVESDKFIGYSTPNPQIKKSTRDLKRDQVRNAFCIENRNSDSGRKKEQISPAVVEGLDLMNRKDANDCKSSA